MQVAQISQRRPILVAHSFGELRIIQPLIPRELRHVLQNAESLPNRLPPIRRHLSPLWKHVVPDVALLYRRKPVPGCNPPLQFLSLRRRHSAEPIVIIEDSLLFLRAQIAEFPLCLRWSV